MHHLNTNGEGTCNLEATVVHHLLMELVIPVSYVKQFKYIFKHLPKTINDKYTPHTPVMV